MNYELHSYINSSSEISELKYYFIKTGFSNLKLKKKFTSEENTFGDSR